MLGNDVKTREVGSCDKNMIEVVFDFDQMDVCFLKSADKMECVVRIQE